MKYSRFTVYRAEPHEIEFYLQTAIHFLRNITWSCLNSILILCFKPLPPPFFHLCVVASINLASILTTINLSSRSSSTPPGGQQSSTPPTAVATSSISPAPPSRTQGSAEGSITTTTATMAGGQSVTTAGGAQSQQQPAQQGQGQMASGQQQQMKGTAEGYEAGFVIKAPGNWPNCYYQRERA